MKAIKAYFTEQAEKFGASGPKATFDEDKTSRRIGQTDKKSVTQQHSVTRDERSISSSENPEAGQSMLSKVLIKRKSTMRCNNLAITIVQALGDIETNPEFREFKKAFGKYKIDDFKGLPKEKLDLHFKSLKLRLVDDKKRYLLAFMHATEKKLYKYVM